MAQDVKTVCGVAIADVKTVAGVAIADVKTIVGVDNTSGGSSVAYDAAGSLAIGGDGTNTATWNHTCTGSNRGLFVGVGWFFNAATVLSITYAGVPMIPVWSQASATITNKSVGYFLAAPASGTNAIVVTFSGNQSNSTIVAGASVSVTGCHQTVPVGTPSTATSDGGTGTLQSVTVGSVGASDLLVDFLTAYDAGTGITVGANQTSRFESENLFSNIQYFGASTQAGSDGGAMSWTSTNAATYYAYGAVAIKPA